MRALLLALPLLLANTAAEDPVIPPTIKSMLDAAMQSGSEGDVAVIVKYARNAASGERRPRGQDRDGLAQRSPRARRIARSARRTSSIW